MNFLVSVIIPTMANYTNLKNCLDTLIRSPLRLFPDKYEIIIVSNSPDASAQRQVASLASAYGARLLVADRSLGYTRAVNMGLKSAAGSYLLVANDDVEFFHQECLFRMIISIQSSPRVGLIGCKLLYPDHTIQHGGMVRAPGQPNFFLHRYMFLPRNTPQACKVEPVVAVTGALIMIKKELLKIVGYLDENLILTCSDVDYCLRVRERGFNVVYNGLAEAVHLEAKTRRGDPYWAAVEAEDIKKFGAKWARYLLAKNN